MWKWETETQWIKWLPCLSWLNSSVLISQQTLLQHYLCYCCLIVIGTGKFYPYLLSEPQNTNHEDDLKKKTKNHRDNLNSWDLKQGHFAVTVHVWSEMWFQVCESPSWFLGGEQWSDHSGFPSSWISWAVWDTEMQTVRMSNMMLGRSYLTTGVIIESGFLDFVGQF